jgi:hypothetical protein
MATRDLTRKFVDYRTTAKVGATDELGRDRGGRECGVDGRVEGG